MKLAIFLFLTFLLEFTFLNKETSGSKKIDKLQSNNETFVRLDKLAVLGDFDGDGKIDTLIQNTICKINNHSIDSIPFFYEWDSTARFVDSIQTDITLTLLNRNSDTLHFGNAVGLYCLINIGDNNKDKKDEIALVVDYCDFSNCNSCYIYSFCENKLVTLNSFRIHESAFEYEGDKKPIFNEIKGFLEFRGTKWMYIDYYKLFEADKPKDTLMKPLKIKNAC